jgi:hypothetical protein
MENTAELPPPDTTRASRYRVIEGTLYARATTPSAYRTNIHHLGNGYVEAVTYPHYSWAEVDSLSAAALDDSAMAEGNIWVDGAWHKHEPTEAEKLEKLTSNKERAVRRAKTKMRRIVKHRNLSTMLTCTYRENMVDRARIVRDLDAMIKRIRRVIPGFEYLYVLERQKRGAWHAHFAVKRVQSHYLQGGVLVKSYDMLRAMWRGVVGADNGMVDVKHRQANRRGIEGLVGYLHKYFGKDFGDGQSGENSYAASGRALPEPTRSEQRGNDVRLGVDVVMGAVSSLLLAGAGFSSFGLDGGGYYFAISPPPRGKPSPSA